MGRNRQRHVYVSLAALLLATVAVIVPPGPGTKPALAYETVSGAGSTWVQIALDQWRADIAHQGYLINYQGNGSSAGRSLYITDGVDFAASEIPFQPDELNQLNGANRHWQYLPDVAGGTSLMYNLHDLSGNRVTSLRLDADAAAKIFTGRIRSWKDPEILSLNPGLQTRESRVIPVIRSDGSGTSAQFSLFLASQAGGVWSSFVAAYGCPAPCSLWPPFGGSINANGSDSVANFVANDSLGSGAVGYVEAGYAYGRGFPVASLLNASGNFVQPSSLNVAVALRHATLNRDLTQNLVGVYRAPEPSAYPMSSYSYMIVPCVAPSSAFPTCSTGAPPNFDSGKGFVLGTWIIYIACAGQREAAPLGYSPLPPNLIQADLDAVSRLPGHPSIPPVDYRDCPNPTLRGDYGPATPANPLSGTGSSAPGGSLTSAGRTARTLGPASVDVNVLDAGARARTLAAGLATAAAWLGPARTPLWIAMLVLVLLVFAPVVLDLFAKGKRRRRVD